MKLLLLLIAATALLSQASFLMPRRKQDLQPAVYNKDRFPSSALDLFRMFDAWEDFSLFPQMTGNMLMDIKETPTNYEVHVDLPGVDKENVKILVSPDHRELQITAFREGSAHEEGHNYRLVERFSGNMTRTVVLPDKADIDKLRADFKSGVLTITIDKIVKSPEECKQREITIN